MADAGQRDDLPPPGVEELRAQPHVLIVEDNLLASGALRVLFEQTGHQVRVAATAEEAMSAVATDAPDLMLLDLGLPDGDGFGVLTRLQHEGKVPRVVVALTGHDDPAIVRRCHELGCADVLLKPVPTRELLRRAGEWLAR